MISFNEFVAIGGFILGLLTSLAGFLTWYGSSVKKAYAAERDFNHLRRNYEQLAENQQHMLKMLENIDEGVTAITIHIVDKGQPYK